jgi:hypothetical protein
LGSATTSVISRYPRSIDRPIKIIEDVSIKTGDQRACRLEATVFREQMVNFLEAAVVFLLVTNVLSIAATTYAIQLLNGFGNAKREQGIVQRKLTALVQRAS